MSMQRHRQSYRFNDDRSNWELSVWKKGPLNDVPFCGVNRSDLQRSGMRESSGTPVFNECTYAHLRTGGRVSLCERGSSPVNRGLRLYRPTYSSLISTYISAAVVAEIVTCPLESSLFESGRNTVRYYAANRRFRVSPSYLFKES